MAIDYRAANKATRDFPSRLKRDQIVQDYVKIMFDRSWSPDFRHSIYNAMHEYILDNYGLDFDDIFDWDSYRKWYP